MKYSHWYRKLFIRTETPKFKKVPDTTEYSEITPEMVEKYPKLYWNWRELSENPNFISLVISNHIDIQHVSEEKFNEIHKELLGKFLDKIKTKLEKMKNGVFNRFVRYFGYVDIPLNFCFNSINMAILDINMERPELFPEITGIDSKVDEISGIGEIEGNIRFNEYITTTPTAFRNYFIRFNEYITTTPMGFSNYLINPETYMINPEQYFYGTLSDKANRNLYGKYL